MRMVERRNGIIDALSRTLRAATQLSTSYAPGSEGHFAIESVKDHLRNDLGTVSSATPMSRALSFDDGSFVPDDVMMDAVLIAQKVKDWGKTEPDVDGSDSTRVEEHNGFIKVRSTPGILKAMMNYAKEKDISCKKNSDTELVVIIRMEEYNSFLDGVLKKLSSERGKGSK